MRVDSIGLSFDSMFSSLRSNQNNGSENFSNNSGRISNFSDIANTAADYLSNRAVQAKFGVELDKAQAEAAAAQKAQVAPLRDALASTIKFVGQNFGDAVATVVTAMLYKNTSNSLSEESLGQGLLEAASFIDKKLGIDSGDKFLGHLNQTLNPQLNTFFENGKEEVFIAVNTGKQTYTVPGLSTPILQAGQAGEASAPSFETLFNSLKLSLDTLRENQVKQDQSTLIASYDRNGQPMLTNPAAGFLLDEAI